MATGFRPLSRIEIAYRQAISDALMRLIPGWARGMSEGQWLTDLGAVSYSPEMANAAASIAYRMVRWSNFENAKSWRHASRQSQHSQFLYRLLNLEMSGTMGIRLHEIVRENAKLISSIPIRISESLTGEIAEAQQAGARHEVIARMMRNRFPALAQSRVRLIARTETSKASTALTQARSEELELPWFQWTTSEDARVRPAHEHMNGVLVAWNDLPSPEALVGIKSRLGHYAPGNAPNCRCFPKPLLSLEDVFGNGSMRAKVYINGSIQRMTRLQFARLSHIESRVAA